MDADMKDRRKEGRKKGMELMYLMMGVNMRGNGRMTKWKEEDVSIILISRKPIRGISSMIDSMDSECYIIRCRQ